jgi:hypothetical protein
MVTWYKTSGSTKRGNILTIWGNLTDPPSISLLLADDPVALYERGSEEVNVALIGDESPLSIPWLLSREHAVLTPFRPDRPWGPPNLLSNGYQGLFPWG